MVEDLDQGLACDYARSGIRVPMKRWGESRILREGFGAIAAAVFTDMGVARLRTAQHAHCVNHRLLWPFCLQFQCRSKFSVAGRIIGQWMFDCSGSASNITELGGVALVWSHCSIGSLDKKTNALWRL